VGTCCEAPAASQAEPPFALGEPDSIGILEWLELRKPVYHHDDAPMLAKPAMSPGALRAACWTALLGAGCWAAIWWAW
jgi:hypothetical protein